MLKALFKKLPGPVKRSAKRFLKQACVKRALVLGRRPAARHFLDSLLLDKARSNLAKAIAVGDASLPYAGSRWAGYAAWVHANIDKFRTVIEAISFAQQQIGFEMRAMPPQGRAIAMGQLAGLRARFPLYADQLKGCCESPLSDISHPGSVVRLDDGHYTTSHLSVLEHVFTVTHLLGHFPDSVLEIGGGYGTPARAWATCSLGTIRRYAVLDLPESLFFTELFLKAHFGFESVVNLVEEDAQNRSQRCLFILCPTQRMQDLARLQFEVTINSGSMQEMTDDWISLYERFLARIRTSYFYSANYFLQPLNRMNESMNLWSPRVPSEWILRDVNFHLGSEDEDFRSSLRAFYQCSQTNNFGPAELKGDFNLLEGRPAGKPITREEGLNLALLMDGFRRAPDPKTALRLVESLSSRFPMTFKELAFLVKWLLRKPEQLSAADSDRLAILSEKLAEIRAGGNEGLR